MIIRCFLFAVWTSIAFASPPVDSVSSGEGSLPENYSFARPSSAIVKHMELDLKIDFDNRVLSGKATLFFQNKTNTDKLYLDTRGLVIKRITLGSKNQKTTFSLGEPAGSLGQALIIDILPDTKSVNVWYETSTAEGALQWLTPQQTANATLPFLFTQSQPILARTWLPCQDNPAVRMTYRAKLNVPAGMLAVMSAQNPTKKSPNGTYEFHMPQPIPSYLMALAVGDIEFRQISQRCGVYAEPCIVNKAAWEFAEVESMMAAAEHLCGPYRWQRYDIIVLPPSFPMGGMENPRLTFATPTVLAGDRSLVSLIAHELAHSWSGNLVTNATWDDIWLNEGVTTYIEHRLIEAVYGRKESELHAYLSLQDLKNTIEIDLGPANPDTRLRPDFTGRDLEGAMTGVVYSKGYFFLRALEEAVGRERWDDFLRRYFDTFAFQSITTETFVGFLSEQLIKKDSSLIAKVSVEDWIHKPGMPSSLPDISAEPFARAEASALSFVNDSWTAGSVPTHWSIQVKQHFLRCLPKPLSLHQMSELDRIFKLSESGNGEILEEWYLHVIAADYAGAYPSLEKFLITIGRLKYLRPLYAALAKTPDGMERAQRIYTRARPGYHSITSRRLDQLLK